MRVLAQGRATHHAERLLRISRGGGPNGFALPATELGRITRLHRIGRYSSSSLSWPLETRPSHGPVKGPKLNFVTMVLLPEVGRPVQSRAFVLRAAIAFPALPVRYVGVHPSRITWFPRRDHYVLWTKRLCADFVVSGAHSAATRRLRSSPLGGGPSLAVFGAEEELTLVAGECQPLSCCQSVGISRVRDLGPLS